MRASDWLRWPEGRALGHHTVFLFTGIISWMGYTWQWKMWQALQESLTDIEGHWLGSMGWSADWNNNDNTTTSNIIIRQPNNTNLKLSNKFLMKLRTSPWLIMITTENDYPELIQRMKGSKDNFYAAINFCVEQYWMTLTGDLNVKYCWSDFIRNSISCN